MIGTPVESRSKFQSELAKNDIFGGFGYSVMMKNLEESNVKENNETELNLENTNTLETQESTSYHLNYASVQKDTLVDIF